MKYKFILFFLPGCLKAQPRTCSLSRFFLSGKGPMCSRRAEAPKLPSAPLLPFAVAFPTERCSAPKYCDACGCSC